MTLVKIICTLLLLQCINVLRADNPVDPESPRACYKCEGINCQRPIKDNVTTVCEDELDICVTIFDGNTVTAKGCLGKIHEIHRSKCTKNSPECSKCFGQLCNDKGRVDFKCIVCDFKENSKCVDDTSDIAAVQCPSPTAQNSYCFVRDAGFNEITRGCSVHLQDQLDCQRDKKCSLCLSQDADTGACNTYELYGPRSGASRNVLTFSFGAFFLLLVSNLLN